MEIMKILYNSDNYRALKKKRERSRSIDMLVAGADSIPVVGSTVGEIISLVSENASNNSKFKSAISQKNSQRFFIAPCDDLYEELKDRIIEILENPLIQEQFSYNMTDINSLEIYEIMQKETNEYQYTNIIEIDFVDDDHGTIMIEFTEKYTQINFLDKKVYGVYEIITAGSNHSASKRDYIELASAIYSLISLL